MKAAFDDLVSALLSGLERSQYSGESKDSFGQWREARAALLRDAGAPLPPT